MAAHFRAMSSVGGAGATITVTYSSDFYGVDITATNGTETHTITATSSGEVVFTISEAGTWTISATVDGQTYSETVNVTLEYTSELIAIPDGSTVTPVNSIPIWLKCADIRDKSYTTLSQVLADTETFIALCADSNACNYMARSTNWASGVADDSTAMLIVGKYNYCANALISNATWCAALASSTYWEYIFNGCVPKMTSNTAPSGEVTGTTPRDTTTYALWKAFDRDTSTIYCGNVNTAANNTGGGFIQYHHTEPVCIKGIKLQSHTSNVYPYKSVKVEVSNDGSTYDTIFDDSVDFVTGFVDTSDNIKTGTYTKVTVTQLNDTGSSTYFPRIIDCQFYGRTDNANYIPLVPTMTSNTTPSGECSASSIYGTGYEAYKAFTGNNNDEWAASSSSTPAWIQYKFAEPTCVSRFSFYQGTSGGHVKISTFKIQGSNTGNSDDWTDLYSATAPDNTSQRNVSGYFDNATSYYYYRLYITGLYVSSNVSLSALQFYRKSDLPIIHSAVEDSIFYMDDGSPVALCGIPVGDTIDVDLEAYKGQTLTLVSTVAKDPTNLSNDFTMPVRITPNITEIYLMPIKSLYWWGSECGQTFTSKSVPSTTLLNTTATTNKNNKVLSITTSSSGTFASGYVTSDTKETTDATKLCCLASSASMYNYGGSNVISQCYYSGGSTYASGTQICYSAALTTLTKFETDITSVTSAQLGIMLQVYGASRTSQVTVNALWYE